MKKWIVTTILLLLSIFALRANHAAGGHIDYTFTGNSNGQDHYDILLTFYRDCDGTAALNSYTIETNSSCNVASFTVDRQSTTTLVSCETGTSCYERILYTGTLSVPEGCEEITLTWELNARNHSIYYENDFLHVESTILPAHNNSSVTTDVTNFVACLNSRFFLNLNSIITDPDGNLLVFTLVPPKGMNGVNLTFVSPQTWQNPVPTSPGGEVSLDNDVLTFIPTEAGSNTVFSIRVDEFIGGILVGYSIVDVTIDLTICSNSSPTISNLPTEPILTCVNNEVCYTLNLLDVDGDPITVHPPVWNNGTGTVTSNANSIEVCFTPNSTSQNVSVTITLDDNDPCVSSSQSSHLVEFEILGDESNNIPPYSVSGNGISGIDVNDAYEVFGVAGQQVCFTIQTADSPNEQVYITNYSGLPSGMVTTESNTFQESVEFCWTPGQGEFGEYQMQFTYEDETCNLSPVTDEIIVRIVCPSCPLHITYENRTPNNNPLPATTIAGEWIKAGFSQPVETGTANVLFQAGNKIELGDHFVAGPGFVAEIVNSCWEEFCTECCDDWGGFTYDTPISHWITPDGDNCNDIWYIQDIDHPQGAFGAMGFELEIRDENNILVYKLEEFPGYCDPFTAPGTSPPPCPTQQPQQSSSIFWDGKWNQWPNDGCWAMDGTYYYTLELYSGCGHTANEASYIELRASQNPGYCNPFSGKMAQSNTENEKSLAGQVNLNIYPNPNSGSFTIEGSDVHRVEFYDALGALHLSEQVEQNKLEVYNLSIGVYLVRVYDSQGLSMVRRVVVF